MKDNNDDMRRARGLSAGLLLTGYGLIWALIGAGVALWLVS